MLSLRPSLSDIREAARRIGPYINRTPVLTSSYFNRLAGGYLFFKCENFQKAGAFKSRGAVNAVFQLPESMMNKGVATHSSGNHAQALARAAGLRSIPAYIVMPENSSKVKIAAVKEYGGIIRFCTPTLEARETTLAQVLAETGANEVHPYNDLRTMAGQATCAMELLEDQSALDFIIAPVGGGGLLSGSALTTRYISPSTKIIAVEPEQADDAFRSFKGGSFVPSVMPDTIADGLRTSLGSLTFPIIMELVDDIVTVSEASIIKAMHLCWERMKIIIEPSSAVTIAAILDNKVSLRGKRAGIILSGGNAELDKLPWQPAH